MSGIVAGSTSNLAAVQRWRTTSRGPLSPSTGPAIRHSPHSSGQGSPRSGGVWSIVRGCVHGDRGLRVCQSLAGRGTGNPAVQRRHPIKAGGGPEQARQGRQFGWLVRSASAFTCAGGGPPAPRQAGMAKDDGHVGSQQARPHRRGRERPAVAPGTVRASAACQSSNARPARPGRSGGRPGSTHFRPGLRRAGADPGLIQESHPLSSPATSCSPIGERSFRSCQRYSICGSCLSSITSTPTFSASGRSALRSSRAWRPVDAAPVAV